MREPVGVKGGSSGSKTAQEPVNWGKGGIIPSGAGYQRIVDKQVEWSVSYGMIVLEICTGHI
jgi:hypothetical protein